MALRNVIHICISCHESNYTFQLTTEHGFIMHKFLHILTIVVSYGEIVHVLLKRAARIILDCDVSVPSIVLFSKHRWMTFPERVIYQKAIPMLRGEAPDYSQTSFTFSSDVHTKMLRSSSTYQLYVAKPNLEIFSNTFVFSDSSIWNSLTYEIQNSTSIQQ